MPWTRAGAAALEAYRQARDLKIEDAGTRGKLVLMLYDGRDYEEALAAGKGLDTTEWRFFALVWQRHLLDLLGRRAEAEGRYQEALKMPRTPSMRHDQYGITIDKKWVEERLKRRLRGRDMDAERGARREECPHHINQRSG